jgi:hypothetical protein
MSKAPQKRVIVDNGGKTEHSTDSRPKRFTDRSTSERSTVPGVPLLFPRSVDSWVRWKNAITNYCRTHYTEITNCLEGDDRKYKVIPLPTSAEYPEDYAVSEKDLQAEIVKQVAHEYVQSKARMAREKISLKGIIEASLSPDSAHMLRTNKDYAVSKDDPIALFGILLQTHAVPMLDGNDSSRGSVARVQYAQLKMMSHESIIEFKNRFTVAMELFIRLCGPDSVKNTLISDFAGALDDNRYRSFKSQLRVWENTQNVALIPKTIDEVIILAEQSCSSLVPDSGRVTYAMSRERNTVFAAQVERDLSDITCYGCGQKGHLRPDCPATNKKKRRNKKKNGNNIVSVAKAVTIGLTETSAGINNVDHADEYECIEDLNGHVDDFSEYTSYTLQVEANTCKYEKIAFETPKFILDTGANKCVIGSDNLLNDIHCVEEPFRVRTARGITLVDRIGYLPGFGEALYMPGSPNLISMRAAEYNFSEIEYSKGKFFKLYKNNNDIHPTITFNLDENSLYTANCNVVNAFFAVDTVQSRKTSYSKEELIRAERARDAIRMLGFPSDGGLYYNITHGVFIDNPITQRDLEIAADIYGRDVASLMGKATIPPAIRDSMVIVNQSFDKKLDMFTDIMFVEELPFMVSVLKPIGLILVTNLTKSKKTEYMESILTDQVNIIKSRGFSINRISVDPARELAGLSFFGIDKIPVITVGPNTHVHIAERYIRTIKDRCRAVIHSVPWHVPRNFIKYIVSFVVIRLNNMAKASIGPVSPFEKFIGRKINFLKEIRVGFGDYVHIKTKSKSNSMEERTRGCIALMPLNTLSGTHLFFSLDKGTIIRADSWVALPTPDIVIRHMDRYAEVQLQIHTGIKTKLPRKNDGKLDLPDRVEMDAGIEIASNWDPNSLKEEENVDPNNEETSYIRKGLNVENPNPVVIKEEPYETMDEVQVRETELVEDPPVVVDKTPDVELENVPVVVYETPDTQIGIQLETISEEKLGRGERTKKSNPKYTNLHISVDRALEKYPEKTNDSVEAELREIWDRNVLLPIMPDDMPKYKGIKVLRSFLFLKEKLKVDGTLNKLKSRLVADGSMQKISIYDNVSSPTAKLESILMVLALAAAERRFSVTLDIGNAFLESTMKGEDVLMELSPFCVKVLLKFAPHLKPYINGVGKIIVKLQKSLYGCVQSAKIWYEHLRDVLLSFDFIKNEYDNCVFNKTVNGAQITVVVYVDDILITCKNKLLVEDVINKFKMSFKEVKVSDFDDYEYLGFEVKSDENVMKLSMQKYIRGVLDERGVVGNSKSPANIDLFKCNESSPLLSDDKKKLFHRHVAQLLFLAKRFRFDCLLAISVLTSKVQSPTEQDDANLDKVYKYIASTKDFVLQFTKGGAFNPSLYIDASYACHEGAVSRTGAAVIVCGGCVGAWTHKQKIVTKSSTEAELVALSDASSYAIWARNWLIAQGHGRFPFQVFQDNQSVLSLMRSDDGPSKNTRHVNARYFYVRGKIRNKSLKVDYTPTKQMIADVLTKPLVGELFCLMRQGLGLVQSSLTQ